jgi:hypothetical protein
LQVHARGDQLQPLLMAMPDWESLHAWGLSSACCVAPHAIRAWRRALLSLQVWKFSSEASIRAVLYPQPLNFLLTLLPVHPFPPGRLAELCELITMPPDRHCLRGRYPKLMPFGWVSARSAYAVRNTFRERHKPDESALALRAQFRTHAVQQKMAARGPICPAQAPPARRNNRPSRRERDRS